MVLRHGVLVNLLVECFSLVVPNMVLSKLNIQKLVSQHTRGCDLVQSYLSTSPALSP